MRLQTGAALLRLAAFGVTAVLVALVLAVFSRGASTPDEVVGVTTLQAAVFFFGPIAAIAALAFIVVVALTRPVSLAQRRRAARIVAFAYGIIGVTLAVLLSSTWWGLLGSGATAVCAGLAWWFLAVSDTGPS